MHHPLRKGQGSLQCSCNTWLIQTLYLNIKPLSRICEGGFLDCGLLYKESLRKYNKTMVFHKEMYYNIESVRMHAYYIHKREMEPLCITQTF